MTVNVGLITSDALVLGCDSVASVTAPLLDPFHFLEVDHDGKIVTDENDKLTVKFDFQDLQPTVTSAWGGVTKMFQIHPAPSPVVAVTAGAAKLLDRSITSHAGEFFREREKAWQEDGKGAKRLVNVEPICRAFLKFMRSRYLLHYQDALLPEPLWSGPEFLVGGIGRDDTFPSLYRVSVRGDSMECHFSGGHCGIAWNGQADAIERFIRGYDRSVMVHVEATIKQALEEHGRKTRSYVTNFVNGVLDQLAQELPEGTEIDAPSMEEVSLDLERFAPSIDYRNLPLQEAVNFASAMVMTQASLARFCQGVATVGGRTHIGIVTKERGFWAPNEPEITHRFTGLGDDV